MKIVAATFFTENWCYSVDSWLAHFIPAAKGLAGKLLVSTDCTKACSDKFDKIKEACRQIGWESEHLRTAIDSDDHKAYDKNAQLIIARIQQRAFNQGRIIDPDYFWCIESDILVPPNAAKVLLQALEFDEGYFSVAMITYPNGQFLGGRGTQQNPICEDFTEGERKIPDALAKQIKERDRTLKKLAKENKKPSKEQLDEWELLSKKIKECPPVGNIFALQSKRWRKRGWLESAYPAIGRGAILPTDWVGLGCTMLNSKALSMATYEGYELRGTQDLFLCWHRWNPAGLKMCVIPHVLCSHVKKAVDKDGKRSGSISIHEARHEFGGELDGHVRWSPREYINFN